MNTGLRTCWAKFDNGVIWNFTSDMWSWIELGCFMTNIAGLGYENKLTLEVVGTDFIETESEPQVVIISGDLYFDSEEHYKLFDKLFNDNVFKFYFDGNGLIDPQDQISKAWYKECKLTSFELSEKQSHGFYVAKVEFTPTSSKAKRDMFESTTLAGVLGKDLKYPKFYPYFYSSGQQLISKIDNEGNKTGVVIRIKNTGTTSLEKVNFYVDSENDVRQYASWLYSSIKLEPGRTLVVDSRARTQEANVYTDAGEKSDVRDLQHPNPQYINYVEIYTGSNEFIFDFGRVTDVEVTIEIQEESGVL